MDTRLMVFEYSTNKANLTELTQHLSVTADDFIPPLHQRVTIADYAMKLIQNATRVEAWHGHSLIGLVAVYLNNLNCKTGYISSVSVDKHYRGHKLAKSLLQLSYQYCLKHGFTALDLEVNNANIPAQQLYKTEGFVLVRTNNSSLFMQKQLGDNHVTTKL